jgi:hypothetical protein
MGVIVDVRDGISVVWGPIRRRMGWVLAANRVRRSIGTVLPGQSGPRLIMVSSTVPGNSVFDAVAARTQGLGEGWVGHPVQIMIFLLLFCKVLPSPLCAPG